MPLSKDLLVPVPHPKDSCCMNFDKSSINWPTTFRIVASNCCRASGFFRRFIFNFVVLGETDHVLDLLPKRYEYGRVQAGIPCCFHAHEHVLQSLENRKNCPGGVTDYFVSHLFEDRK